jgi:2-iminobutanoate/2-iminopropanoate deaminase
LDIYSGAKNSSAVIIGRMKSAAEFLTSRFKGATLAVIFMATKSIIKPAKSPAAVGPYNHAVRVGDLLFCAGQIPISPADGNLIAGDIKVQTERVLENVKAILDDQKLTFANVVKSTVFLTDLANFAGMNEVYAKYFTENFPARSTIQVAGLPKGASVEIEVVAHF